MINVNKNMFLTVTFAVLCMTTVVKTEKWCEITPLRSTQSDVERVIGKKADPGVSSARYELDQGTVYVLYSSGKCGDSGTRWNVPEGTVLEVSIYHKNEVALSSLNLNPNEFFESRGGDAKSFVNYFDPTRGIKYTVYEGGDVPVVRTTAYLPDASDYEVFLCPKKVE